MIVSNFFVRARRIRSRVGLIGAAFTIDLDGQQFLVTARHLLPDGSGPFQVWLDGYGETDSDMYVDPMPGMSPDADVAVMRLDEPLTESFPVEASMDGMQYGQDCYFLGYPYGLGLGGEVTPQLAFIKKAILSASDRTGGTHRLYLDGHNNPGFSGGPVVFYKNGDIKQPCIAAVVSAYRVHEDRVLANGSEVPNTVVEGNSGIIVATDIAHAVAVARGEPLAWDT